MVIDAKVIGRRAFLQNLNQDQVNEAYAALSILVPGAEYSPQFKSKKWDGFNRYFDWQYKACPEGLLKFLERKTGWQINITETDRDYSVYDIEGFEPKDKAGKVLTPRDYQDRAIRALLTNNGGLASLATNAGKTLAISAIAYAYAKVGKSVLILEGMVDLANQVQQEVAANTGMSVALYSAGKKVFGQKITVAMVKSLAKAVTDGTAEEDLANIDAIIVDECHHALNNTIKVAMTACSLADRYGMSGTIKTDEHPDGLALRAMFGEVVETVYNAELIARGISAKPIVKMIEYALESNFDSKLDFIKKEAQKTAFKYKMNPITKKSERHFSPGMYTAKVKEFVMNYAVKQSELFWQIIKTITVKHQGQSIVVIADWVDQAEALAAYLGATAFHGQSKHRETILADFESGKIPVLVVTQVLDEGLSINRIKVLILASTGYSTRQMLQRLGRGLRAKTDGDNTLHLYDFIRYGHKYLIGPSKERYKLWKGQGFEPQLVEWEDYAKS